MLIILLPDSVASFLEHGAAEDWPNSAVLLLCDPTTISAEQLQRLRELRPHRYWLVDKPEVASDETLIDYEQWIELTLRFDHTFFWPTT
jgi:hypothetical protein